MDPNIMQLLQAAASQQQQQQPQDQGGGGGGLGPFAMMSPLAMLMSKNPKLGLGMISPAAGIANALGAFK